MSDALPSIEDLLKKKQATSAPAQPAPPKQPSKPKASTPPKASVTEELDTKLQNITRSSKEKETEVKAKTSGFEYIDLKGYPISADALSQIPFMVAKKQQVICFLFTGPEIRIGAVEPQKQEIKDLLFQLTERNKAHGSIYQITEDSLEHGKKLYSTLPRIQKIKKGVEISEEELKQFQDKINSFADIASVLKDASTTDIIAIVIAAALKVKTSDIHIEAEEKGITVRFRVDGMLQEITTINKDEWKKMINRIKLVAGLKMNILDKPQDGRFTINAEGKKIDVRTSTLPTAWGESVVMRILNPDSISLDFSDLGFREASFKRLEKEFSKPHGMIITTGPTGSGKTTTLYAILSRLNVAGTKIITLEDPIEYKVEGLNQSQINHSKEYTFAKGLRSILRQDPDVVMVGEIRDLETAETAIQAALTGHLLLSTIHTNDASGAIPRFNAMGVKPFLLAPAVNVIMGQRLARRLCAECSEPDTPDAEVMKKITELLTTIPEASGETPPDLTKTQFKKAKGCPKCNNTGYKGRMGIYEILIKDADIEKFILSGEVSEYAMKEVAQKQGMLTMTQDGLLKAYEGHISIEEIQRIAGL